MSKKLIPAVGYARRSTDMQERSIPDQQAFVERWAAQHGYAINRWFIDDAISGTSTKGRNAFEQLIATAENGRDFETILCYDISRFSRGGTNETGYYLHRLNLAGVNVVFTAEGIPEGDEGELIQGVKSWQARQYSIKLARDTIRGQISNIRERKSAPGGMAPYGYDKQHLTSDGKLLRTLRWLPDGSKQEFGADGKLLRVIEPGVNIKKAKSDIIRYVLSTPDRVATMKHMFELCVQGYGYHYIAEAFNSEGILSPGGLKWNTARVGKLIRNPVYRGAIAWNRHSMGSLFGLDGQGVLKPKRTKGWKRNADCDWIIAEDVHEPIVSKETWSAAQRAVAKRRELHGKARPTKRTLLASLLVCKRCGSSFTTVRDRRWPGPTGEGYRCYTCSGYHRYGKSVCGVVNIPGPALDQFVLKTIRQTLLGDHATVKQAIDAFVKAVLAPRAKPSCTKADDRELDLINRKIKATVAMLSDPNFDGLDELKTTLADLKAKRDGLEARLKASAAPATPAISEKDLRAWALEQFARIDDLATRSDIDLKDRQMVEAFVERIEVNPEAKTGFVVLHAGLEKAYADGSTRLPGGEGMGMAGLFIIHPRRAYTPTVDHDFALLIQEWAILPQNTIPNTMSMEFNFFTLNGRSGPYTTPLLVRLGSRVRIRFVNMSVMDHHPMHLHGHTFWITGTEAGRIPETAWMPSNNVLVGVAQARDIEFIANNPGDWMIHCHMFHHMMNHMTSMVGPMGSHGMQGMPAGNGMQSGLGMITRGHATSPELGPSIGRGMGEQTGNERTVRNGPHGGDGHSEAIRVPGFPQDMMDMHGMYSEAQLAKINKTETLGMRRNWFAGVEALMTVLRVLPPELYDRVLEGDESIPPGASVPGGGQGAMPGMPGH